MRPRRCGWLRTSWLCERRWSSARARNTRKKLSAVRRCGGVAGSRRLKAESLLRNFMKAEKIRNLTDVGLNNQERELADQLFKLKFQLNMGQTESLKKIRGLRKDIARVKTIVGERERSTATEKR